MVIKSTYKDSILTLDSTVISRSDITFEINSDIEFTGFLVITYKNKTQRTIDLIKTNIDYVYRGRYKVYQEDLQNLPGEHTIKLCVNNGLTNTLSNAIPITFNIGEINQTITLDSNKEIIKLKKELSDLKQIIYNLQSGNIITSFNINNPDSAEFGDIPVLVNKKGIYSLKKPFANTIEQVNGIYPDKGAVEITAADIKISQMTLEEFLTRTSNALIALKEYNDVLKAEVVNLTSKCNNLELELQRHLSNPII